jgi:hypothetical protein
MAWRIQGGVPISKWRPQEREWAHQLIPEHEAELDGDFLEQTRTTYEKARAVGKLPPFEKMLATLGPVGETVLDLQRARKILAHQTLAAERMPDLLYGRPRDGLPRTLEAGPNEPPSPWAEIRPGVFARVTIIRGNMGRNVLDVRVTPQALKPSAADHSRSGFAIVPAKTTITIHENPKPGEPRWTINIDETPVEEDSVLEFMFKYISGLIAYPQGRPAQALILVPDPHSGGYGHIGIRG